jgi:polar amino acid transport system substrate-binding protein
MKQIVTVLVMGLTFCNVGVDVASGQPGIGAPLKIGFIADQAPFSIKIEGKAPEGYAIDICTRIAADLGGAEKRPVEYVQTALADAFATVAERRVDMLCGAITINLERRKLVDFSQPIFQTGAGALLRTDSPRDLRELFLGERTISPPRSPQMHAFATSKIGVRAASTTETTLRQALARGAYSASIVNFPTHAEGVAALEARQIDAYFADGALLGNLKRNAGAPSDLIIGDKLLTYEAYGIAIRRDDPDFRLSVDQALSHFYRTNDFAALLKTYFGDEAPAIREEILLQALPD